MDRKHNRFWRGIVAVVLCVILLVPEQAVCAAAPDAVPTARPSLNGRLHVQGTGLADEGGTAVQLRGVSTHGLTWYPGFVSESLFAQVSEDWNCNLVRLAMYASIYCGEEREESYALLKRGIEAAVAADMYVLVDWHMLEKGDPNEEADEAEEFFARVTAEYPDCPNLLFEICNEPNGEADWGAVLTYAERIIPVIRERIPEAVIVVGTPEWDRSLGGARLRPLDFDNILYVLHFYAASHGEGLRGELKSAVDAGMPVFISECGICEADGDGRIDFASAAEWFSYLNEHKISYAVWSLSDKDESSAMFRPGFDPSSVIRDGDLSTAGAWVRELIRGADPRSISVSAAVVEKSRFAEILTWVRNSVGTRGREAVASFGVFAAVSAGIVLLGACIGLIYARHRRGKRRTYDDIAGTPPAPKRGALTKIVLLASVFFTFVYLCWRVIWSVPAEYGVIAVCANILLLAVEVIGFAESLILFRGLLGMREHPLPEIPEDAWPDVDVFIATYNEPTELLRRTVNGCRHMKYPDPAKVHIWICDDNRRPEMRALAEKMSVGYFDRPDNKGAKAGNLNHALGLTSAPYVVTFDADMIPRSDFLLKTIPYFVDAELREAGKPESERLHLGLLQTPQSFYDPDVFQHALYSERRAPNEQDFFYRTIEPAKTATNSVIYGGSNTVLSRRALEEIGGFYTESITEDFATGLLIESAGYVSLALPEPLASGQTPHTFREHIKQRTRWGRGVIVTARKLKIRTRKGLTFAQRLSYRSSVLYWYSPIKNLIYMLSPLLYAVFAVPVFRCSWLELLVFWLPAFFLQDLSLRVSSRNAISTKWSGIYETSVMAHLLIPIVKESLGITLSSFKVTDKAKKRGRRARDVRAMIPFFVLIALSVAGIVRLAVIFEVAQAVGLLVLLFWIIRNLYFLLMALFLIDGRDDDCETVKVWDAEPVTAVSGDLRCEGVTTLLTEHSATLYLDEAESLTVGARVSVTFLRDEGEDVTVSGIVTGIASSAGGFARTYTVEILEHAGGDDAEYLQLLYDRVPTLPQSLHRDFGVLSHLWENVANRVARTSERGRRR